MLASGCTVVNLHGDPGSGDLLESDPSHYTTTSGTPLVISTMDLAQNDSIEYVPVIGAVRHGARPPKLPPLRSAKAVPLQP